MHHSYNKDIHNLTSRSPFQVGLGFQPLCLIDVAMPHATTQAKSTHVFYEVDKVRKFI